MFEFAILGPLEVRMDGRLVPVRGARQRALLALLLLHAHEVVSSDRLIEELWGPEARADTAVLRVRVSQLRKALRPASADTLLETRAPGYRLRIDPDRIDAGRFARLAAQAARALNADPDRAASAAGEALALWRGPPLAEFAYEPFAQTAIGRLEELRLVTLEKRIEAELVLGLAGELVGELRALVAEQPLRERFRAQLMLALYRAGRQAEALEAYQQTRQVLVEELGLEPGPELQELHRAVLAQDPSLRGPARTTTAGLTPASTTAPLGEGRHESRKTVTVLYCDVIESETLGEHIDTEVLRRVMERCFEASAKVVRGYGGTVGEFIGGAVTAVFGIPTAHEDDALRAVRAAVELRRAFAELNDRLSAEWKVRLTPRLGLNTGEVVAADDAVWQAFSAGDAVNTAARLQQAARPGEVLLGDATWRLVSGAAQAELVSVPTPGEGVPMPAWRLLGFDEAAPAIPRRFDTPFVGRATELAQLRSAYERTCRERAPCLFTVFGEAGIGKTRLAEEARLQLLPEARVLVGRCLPYGEGVTFAPLREVVQQAVGDEPVEALAVALTAEPDGKRVADVVNGLLGVAHAAVMLEEGFWGVRRLCESLARLRPLVLVFEDVHWAEATMLDLIESVADAREAELLLLCLARHELLERRPSWGGGKLNAVTVALEPLAETDAGRLADWLIGDPDAPSAVRAQVVEAAEGNPLFIEQLVAMLADRGSSNAEQLLPATIAALLAARLELLGPAERMLLEYASVLGDRLSASALARLAPSDVQATLTQHLQALVRKDLLRAARLADGSDGYRFRHVLVREAAYRRLPKEERAVLHERYADWLESAPGVGAVGGRDELLGYHLERAYTYRVELMAEDAQARGLAERASTHLSAAAAEAFARTDFRAVDQLLRRATSLMMGDDPRRPALLYDRGTALQTLGRQDEAGAVLADALEAARAAGDERSAWRARVDRALFGSSDPSSYDRHRAARFVHDALGAFERLHDERGLARAWLLAASIEADRGRTGRMQAAVEHVLHHARKSGVYREEAWGLWWLAHAILVGPIPAALGIARCEELLRGRDELRVGDVGVLGTLALLQAMQGDFDHGRELIRRGRELMENLGHYAPLGQTMVWRAQLELLAGDAEAAEAALREAEEILEHPESDWELAVLFARARLAQGHADEAAKLAHQASNCVPAESRPAQAGWRSLLAAARAAQGEGEEAVALASEAVRLLRATDLLSARADTLVDLAGALAANGRSAEAAGATGRALALYARKGNLVAARRASAVTDVVTGRA
jgi:DNA-binding SARP family transcriptional activator